MGTKILGVIAFAAIAIAADWNYQQNKQEVELSDLALENIDALLREFHRQVVLYRNSVPSGSPDG